VERLARPGLGERMTAPTEDDDQQPEQPAGHAEFLTKLMCTFGLKQKMSARHS
jgi:hypothetical protein